VKRFLRGVVFLLVVGALVAGAVLLVRHRKRVLGAAPRFGLEPRPVTVAVAGKGELVLARQYLARVEAIREAKVSARVTAVVKEVRVDEGDTVEAGGPVAILDADEVRMQVAGLDARIEEARADLAGNAATLQGLESSHAFWRAEAERHRQLAEEEAFSKAEAERTAARAAEVKGNLEAARQRARAIGHRIESLRVQKNEVGTRLGYYTLRSPYTGVVAARLADPGDLATPGKVLLVIEDRTGLRLAFDVPQDDLPEVRQGLEVTFPAGNRTQSALLTVMHPALNRARMMRAEVLLPAAVQGVFSSGATVSISVVLRREEGVTLVPRSSLIESPAGENHVFVVKAGRLEARPVRVIGYSGGRAGLEGVEAGERVVRNTFLGWARLSSGEKVEAVK